MHVPEIHEQRKKISGLKMPRRYSPRLPGASTKGQVPVNPFQGNKMKVASLSTVREAQLAKTASAEEQHRYAEMCKLAESADGDRIRMFLAQNPELEKEGGIVGYGFRMLSKALAKGGAMTGSSKMTQYAGKAAKRSSKAFQDAATKATQRNVALQKATGTSGYTDAASAAIRKNTAQAEKMTALAKQQQGFAKAHGRTAGKQVANAKKPPVPTPAATTTATDAASPLISNSTLGKAIVGGTVVGGTGLAGYGAYKGYQRGQRQNLQASQTGFNYGM